MGKTHQQLTAALSPERRKRNADRVVKLIAEERSRRERRLVHLVTQHRLKRSLVNPRSISQLAKRTDTLLSTLRDHVRRMGGELVVTVRFRGSNPVQINGFADLTRAARSSRSLGRAASVRERSSQRAHVSTGRRKSKRKPRSSHSE